jgi:hypothetical protein
MTARFAALIFAIATAACGSAPVRAPLEPASTEYPGILHPPSELSPDFAVEQHVELRKGDRHGAFDGVLQKRGGELVLIGLGPMGVRAFVLRQEGAEARFEQSMGPALPFPPRNVLVDIHRAFFKRLPVGDGAPSGTQRGEIDGEDVTEIWRAGSLVERRFERPDFRKGAVRVLYGPGCAKERCEPSSVRIVNEWFGYEIAIENRRYHRL